MGSSSDADRRRRQALPVAVVPAQSAHDLDLRRLVCEELQPSVLSPRRLLEEHFPVRSGLVALAPAGLASQSVVGYLSYAVLGPVVAIGGIGVARPLRRRRIGGRLIETLLERELSIRGRRIVLADVPEIALSQPEAVACEFFKALGFRSARQRRKAPAGTITFAYVLPDTGRAAERL